jgi:response regulator NasT
MTKSLKVAVADDEPDVLEFYEVILSELGHEVTCLARNGRELVDQCRASRPDLVIIDVKMPKLDGIDAIRQLSEGHPIPAIVVSGFHDPETLQRAEEDHVLAYLIKPIREADLVAAIRIAMRQYEESEALRTEVVGLLQAMDDQQTIVCATRALMKLGLNDEQAAEQLQELARQHNRPLAEIARTVEAIQKLPAKS